MSIPSLPSRAGLPPLPGVHVQPVDPQTVDVLQVPDDTLDQYGLGVWARDVPRQSRYYIGIAYRHFEINGQDPPSLFFGPGKGTVPELATFGWLLDHGYAPNEWSARGFTFQVNELGGREAGGAVVDFEVRRNHRRIGVLVNSIYHQLGSPYGGGAAVAANTTQIQRLGATGRFDAIIEVNVNQVLEFGTDTAIEADLARIDVA